MCGGTMSKKNTPPKEKINIGRDLAYMIVLPMALSALSQKKRRKYKSQSSNIYENLLCLKNSLDNFFITSTKKNSEEYKQQLYRKILVEKLILNIAAGKNSEIKQNLEQIMKDEGLKFVEKEESLISQEEKFLIKTEFHGISHYPSKEQLSAYFQNYIKDGNEKAPSSYTELDYVLDNIPSWKYFKQFASFKKRASIFAKALAEKGLPPQEIQNLNAYDMVAIFKNYNQKHDIPNFETAKSKFIKYFISHHEADYRAYMQENKAVILYALRNKGIELDIKKNHHAYEEFVEKNIILMKSKGCVPPLFNIHHKHPVKDSKTEKNLSMANSPKNLCLILECPYHNMLHLFDTNVLGKTIFNRKVKRVELPHGMIFFGGFSRKFQIYRQNENGYSDILAQMINNKQNQK